MRVLASSDGLQVKGNLCGLVLFSFIVVFVGCQENDDLENDDLENDDLENDDLENDDRENDDPEHNKLRNDMLRVPDIVSRLLLRFTEKQDL